MDLKTQIKLPGAPSMPSVTLPRITWYPWMTTVCIVALPFILVWPACWFGGAFIFGSSRPDWPVFPYLATCVGLLVGCIMLMVWRFEPTSFGRSRRY